MTDRIYTTEEIRKLVAPVAGKYGVGKLALFGSYARGDANPNSDIDLRVVDKGKIIGYFELAGLQLDLEESLGIRVDMLTTGALSSEFLARISKEEIIVYEQPQEH